MPASCGQRGSPVSTTCSPPAESTWDCGAQNTTWTVVVQSLSHVRLFAPHGLYSPPGSSIHGTLQARILEWVAIAFSRGSSQPRHGTWVSCIGGKVLYCESKSHSVLSDSLRPHRLYSLWNSSEYWGGLPCPPPGDLPNPGTEPRSPTLQVDSLPAEPPGKPKYTGVASLYLLQSIFLTQELNQGLLHCRQIFHQLSYHESLGKCGGMFK